ncbi:MAG: RIP metalloprotease RseP [Candidatus Neomarinimicrobiota bacterium]
MTTLVAAIIVIGAIVFVHELGHYFAARSVGVRVDRFSIGFPPRLLTFTSLPDGWLFRIFFYKRDENGKVNWAPIFERMIGRSGRKGTNTEYCIALIPFGGYVKMAGMIDESMDTEIKHEPYELMSKPAWAQVWVMSAGVIMNVITAILLYTAVSWVMGLPEISDEPVVNQVIEDKPAQAIGLQPGDRILRINDQNISTWSEMSKLVHAIPNTPITLVWEREGEIMESAVTTSQQIVLIEGKIDTLGAIGIYPNYNYEPIGFIKAIQTGIRATRNTLNLIIISVKMLVSGQASMKDIGGPIFIAQIAGETARAGWVPLISLIALFSVNLAFLNILPIPGLDGGHIFITLIESVIRRPISFRVRMIIQQIGMALLLLLMITVLVNDIGRLFTK